MNLQHFLDTTFDHFFQEYTAAKKRAQRAMPPPPDFSHLTLSDLQRRERLIEVFVEWQGIRRYFARFRPSAWIRVADVILFATGGVMAPFLCHQLAELRVEVDVLQREAATPTYPEQLHPFQRIDHRVAQPPATLVEEIEYLCGRLTLSIEKETDHWEFLTHLVESLPEGSTHHEIQEYLITEAWKNDASPSRRPVSDDS